MRSVGVVSDTHGTLDARVAEVFASVDLIVHAGDVGSLHVIDELELVAPVTAVAGNMDSGTVRRALPSIAAVEFSGVRVRVAHRPEQGEPLAADADVVVVGHTHAPDIRTAHGSLVVNPGSASFPRAGRRPTVALLEVGPTGVSARIVEL